MSRFSRLQNGPIRTWAAPESPFRIEYSPALLREVRISSGGVDAFGVLYGIRHGDTIRLIATRGRAGLDPVGVFASRVRGQVFLTEADLERFEKANACVAMVISGETGGFFVRDRDGSLETVRSYQEFSIHGQQVAIVKRRRVWWPWAACLALIPLLFLRPHHAPLALHLRESDGQLKISWTGPTSETLTILDGGERTYVAISPSQTTATYARRSGDVTVGIGTVQARFVGPALPPTETAKMRNSIDSLHRQVVALRAASTSQQTRIAALQRRLQ
jgi:hypothetical protein